ncbi:type IV pilin protein [Marinibactrum halimedae]|nr:type IV pilin protein [Marinibactrum halimedae]
MLSRTRLLDIRFTRAARGFTLIEVMIVVAIVAILAAIAFPSYQSHVDKSSRADAQGALMNFAQAMERHFTNNGTYIGADGSMDEITTDTAPTIFPTQAPLDGGNKMYNLVLRMVTANTYILAAVPIGGGRMEGNGTLALTNTGLRGWDRGGGDDPLGDAENQCWEQSC